MNLESEWTRVLREMVVLLNSEKFLRATEIPSSRFEGAPDFVQRQYHGIRAVAFEKAKDYQSSIESYVSLLATSGVTAFEKHTIMVEVASLYILLNDEKQAKQWLLDSFEAAKNDQSINLSRADQIRDQLGI